MNIIYKTTVSPLLPLHSLASKAVTSPDHGNQAEGLYPDSLILRDRDTASGINSERLYACQDASNRVLVFP